MITSSVPSMTAELASSEIGITLVIHAGAGSCGKHSTSEHIAQTEFDLQRALGAGYQLLESGAPTHEAVVVTIHVMEDAPEFNAGHGAALTSDGIAQMDACSITDDGKVGAITDVNTVKNPIDTACVVKEQIKRVLFTDLTDAEIADWGVAAESSEYFIIGQRRQSLAEAQSGGDKWEKYGTIGAMARDAEGNIAAGMPIGGITNQMHGRVSDSPPPDYGTFTNQSTVAVSCTGVDETFIKVVAAHRVSDHARFSGESVEDAVTAILDEATAYHDDGDMIVLPAVDRSIVAYNSEMMNFGYYSAQGGKVWG